MTLRSPERAAVWAGHLAARVAWRLVHERLAAWGISALPVKGLITGVWLYEDVADRPLTDLDVRVRGDDLARAREALETAGFRHLAAPSPTDNLVYRVGQVLVDVETTIGPPGLCGLEVSEMIARAERSDLFGFSCLVPNPVDHALLIVVNAFKDKLSLASPWALEDLRRVVRVVDASALVQRAEATHSTKILWVVSDWMARHGDRAWARVREAIARPPTNLYRLAWRICDRRPASLPARILSRLGSDRPSDWPRALYYAGRVELWKLTDPEGSRIALDDEADGRREADEDRRG